MSLLQTVLTMGLFSLVVTLPLHAKVPTARVEILLEDRLGRAVLNPRCSLTPSWRSKRSPFQDSCVFADVEYGIYILRTRTPGFEPHEHVLPVFQSELFVRAGLALGDTIHRVGGRPYYSIKGEIRPVLEPANHWLRLVDLHGNSGWTLDAKLSAKGEFRFTTDRPARSLLMVMRKLKGKVEVIHTQAVEVSEFGDTEISVVLDSASTK